MTDPVHAPLADASDLFAHSQVGKARFPLAPGETLAQGLRRCAVEEIAAARRDVADPDLPREEIVHRTRRHIKRLRSLFFVFTPLPGADRDDRTTRLRDIARLLADARDADVVAAEARRLHTHAEAAEIAPLADLVARLDEASRRAHDRTPPLDLVAARLRACEADVQSLPLDFPAGRLLRDALTESYRRGRRDWRDIDDSGGGEEALHDWRKRVKQRRHLTAMVPIELPACSTAVQHDLERLGEILGEEHDLAVLAERLNGEPGLLPDTDRDALLDRLARRRRKLKKGAVELGGELYDRRTSHFRADLAALDEL